MPLIRLMCEKYANQIFEHYYGYILDNNPDTDHYGVKLIGRLDDEFLFEDERCGHCCRDTPAITVYDLERLAKWKKMERQEFYDRYCQKLPMKGYYPYFFVRLKTERGVCIFNKKMKGKPTCTAYELRPGLCRGLPLKIIFEEKFKKRDGVVSFNPRKHTIDDIIERSDFYLAVCPGIFKGRRRTVREWMEETNLFSDLYEWWECHQNLWINFFGDTEKDEVKRAENALRKTLQLSRI